jgi:hypothetical protein
MGRLGYIINEKDRTVTATKSGLKYNVLNMFEKATDAKPLDFCKNELIIPNKLTAVAKCHPNDTWDVNKEKIVARARFNRMYKKYATNAINRYLDKVDMHIERAESIRRKLVITNNDMKGSDF